MSLRISRIETIPVQVPLRSSLVVRSKAGTHTASAFLLLKIHTDEGPVGLGEVSATPHWSGEDPVTANYWIRTYFQPLLVGQDATAPEQRMRAIDAAVAGQPFTKAAVEMALWDLAGKAAGVPLFHLFGGAVREFVRTKWTISAVNPTEAAKIAEWATTQGFRAMKVRVGTGRELDLERVRTVREAVGDEVQIGVDAAESWKPAEAIRMARLLADWDIAFLEQPVPRHNPRWMAEVRRSVNCPVIADESVFTPEDAMSLIDAQAADVLSVYIGKASGIANARRIASLSEAAGISCTIGSNLEMGVASAAMLHLALSTTGINDQEYPCDITGPFHYEGGLLTEPLPLQPGKVLATERPGLGIDLDDSKVARYRIT